MLTLQEIENKLLERFIDDTITTLKSLPHPFLLQNVKEGAEIIKDAIQKQKKILIVGDYDTDGIISTALMILFFQALHYPNLSFAIPNRFKDGYGISIPILQRFKDCEVIITVDNGITALEVADYCKQEGKTLIISDHHNPKEELPNALIINPKVSGFVQEEICGAMVAWYFCAGIKALLKRDDIDLLPFLELTSIATISDMMPLKNINRVIVKKALTLFQSPSFVFSQFLLSQYKKIDEECIGFYIAPLINASGRMAQAEIALSFLLSQNIQDAKKYFELLQSLNQERKMIQNQILEKIQESVLQTQECVLAYGEGFFEGVLGIIAGKLMEEYKKPAFVLTLKEDGYYQGSARAPQGINLLESVAKIQNFVLEFGGHKEALGIKILPQNIQDFYQNFKAQTSNEITKDSAYLGVLHPSLISKQLLNILDTYAPYGEGNPKPYFSIPHLTLLETKQIGKEKNHTHLVFKTPNQTTLKALAFFEINPNPCGYFHITLDQFTHSPMLLYCKKCHF